MKYCAVIIDNRPSKELDVIIQKHMDYLPGWDLKHFSDFIINNGHDYNNILTDRKFWLLLHDEGYEKVLIFQHDSEILREGIEDFLDYSYVGSPWLSNAPWARADRAGGNGGISIRDVKDHLLLLDNHTYDARYGNEDVWYTHNLPNVAPYEICSKFGVETEFKLGAMCTHAINKHLTPDQCKQIRTQYE
jgi:hypothetical protein